MKVTLIIDILKTMKTLELFGISDDTFGKLLQDFNIVNLIVKMSSL
jgi:hypothetical protein